MSAGQSAVHNPFHASTGYGQVIPGVINDGQAIEQLVAGAQAQNVTKAVPNRSDALQCARQHVQDAHASGVKQLPGLAEVQTDLRLHRFLLVGVIRFGALR